MKRKELLEKLNKLDQTELSLKLIHSDYIDTITKSYSSDTKMSTIFKDAEYLKESISEVKKELTKELIYLAFMEGIED